MPHGDTSPVMEMIKMMQPFFLFFALFLGIFVPSDITAQKTRHAQRRHVPSNMTAQKNTHAQEHPLYVPEYGITLTPNLQEIGSALRSIERRSIEGLKKAFPAIPENEWQKTLHELEQEKKYMRTIYFKNAQPKAIHENMSLLNKTISALKERGINPKAVSIKTGNLPCGILATAGALYIYNSTTEYDGSEKITKKKLHRPPTITLSKMLLDPVMSQLTNQSFEQIIHHEITHLLECHCSAQMETGRLIKKYYKKIDKENHPAILECRRIHEYIADLAPCLLYPELATKYRSIAGHAGRIDAVCRFVNIDSSTFMGSPIHPSPVQLRPWVRAIDEAHKNDRKK
jgi:hypothetical protein